MEWALVFDVDGVIADTEALNARVTVEVFRELHGVDVLPEEFRPFIGTGDERYCEGVAEKYGIALDTGLAVRRRAERFLDVVVRDPLPAMPGVLELVTAARSAPEVKLAIATSGNRDKQVLVIEGTGLRLAWFDAVVTGDDVRRKKPDPRIYLLAAERLGLPPARCVVFEDAPAGVVAAKRAGARCVAVTSSVSREALAGADVVVESLADISLDGLRPLVVPA